MSKQLVKRGRKPRSTTASTNLVTLRLTDEEIEQLNLYSWRYDLSRSDAMRFALDIVGVW